MKREFLESMGLTKEQVDSIMTENENDIHTAKEGIENIKKELDVTKAQLATANTTIDGFKDYDDIKNQVTEYKTKYEASENEKQQIKQQYEFNGKLESAAKKYGAKALKAIIPYLDMEKLMNAQNQDTDIDSALKALKENKESAFLFGSEEPIHNPVYGSGTGNKGNELSAVARAMGLTEKDMEGVKE